MHHFDDGVMLPEEQWEREGKPEWPNLLWVCITEPHKVRELLGQIAAHIQRNDSRPFNISLAGRLTKDSERPVSHDVFGVCALLVNQEGRVLTVTRKRYSDTDFGLPGGKVDKGETPLQAVARELFEETGLIAYDAHKAYVGDDSTGKLSMTFIVTQWEGTPSASSEGTVQWRPLTDLVGPECKTFHVYNKALFRALGWAV